MRRMRSQWQYALFVVPVVAVAVGIAYVSERSHGRAARVKEKVVQQIAKLDQDEDTPYQDLKPASKPSERSPASSASTASAAVASNTECTSIEYPGKSPETAHLSKKEWDSVMKEFHDAKNQLVSWLKEHQSKFSPKTYDWMNSRIAEARLQRPPNDDEPDLSWRGIGVLADASAKAPLIRLGAGFSAWVSENPARARFELARLLAQTWAPCEMAKIDSTAPWKEYLGCVDLVAESDPSKACGENSYSEAGWAVSSAVAAQASPPGCRIPAFVKPSVADCVKKAGVSL